MFRTARLLPLALLLAVAVDAQPTYVNAVIPGDHPDPTLTRIGDDYYTSGSSFNVTPKIYHSTDLVHWEVIAQPVSAAWALYDDRPAGGVWGGHTVYRGGQYWHFFGLDPNGRRMYFVTADEVGGPWSEPTLMAVPPGERGFGVDNSMKSPRSPTACGQLGTTPPPSTGPASRTGLTCTGWRSAIAPSRG